jgi:hypothetical protein
LAIVRVLECVAFGGFLCSVASTMAATWELRIRVGSGLDVERPFPALPRAMLEIAASKVACSDAKCASAPRSPDFRCPRRGFFLTSFSLFEAMPNSRSLTFGSDHDPSSIRSY